jgi:hypothetical protein
MSFHVVFYMMFDDADKPYIGNQRYCYSENETWPIGNLYEKGKPIVQVACTASSPSPNNEEF